eukprot:SAG31_NODE_4916_length_2869_cov_3.648375_1_plen_44_part_00
MQTRSCLPYRRTGTLIDGIAVIEIRVKWPKVPGTLEANFLFLK